MNCECIYYTKDTGKDKWYLNNYISVAVQILNMDCELYPVSLSKITENVKCYKDFCDDGEIVTIPKGSIVLFVGGKYHYMDAIRNGRRVLHPYFPVDYEVQFEDITDCEDYNMAIKAHSRGEK